MGERFDIEETTCGVKGLTRENQVILNNSDRLHNEENPTPLRKDSMAPSREEREMSTHGRE